MAANYPTSLDNFTDPISTSPLNSPSHAVQHQNINDGVEKLEVKLGIGASPASGAVNGSALIANGSGTTTWSSAPVGMYLVKTQVIGNGVSTASITGAFSADYDNYFITYTDVTASGTGTAFYFGFEDSGGTLVGSGQYQNGFYMNAGSTTMNGFQQSNGIYWEIGSISGATNSGGFHIYAPFLAKRKFFHMQSMDNSFYRAYGGYSSNTVSYTRFRVLPSSGTITGGTFRIYGYRN